MNNSKKSETAVACAADMGVDEKNMIKLKSPIYTMSKQEMDKQVDTILISTGDFQVVRDPKTGKLLRMKDNRTIGEVSEENRDRLIREFKKNEEIDR